MNINATMLVQIFVFAFVVWVAMKYIWPWFVQRMEEREERIAQGLAKAEQAERALEEAGEKGNEIVREARVKAAEIIDQANTRANQIVEQAKQEGADARARQIQAAHAEIEQEIYRAREQLRGEVAAIAVAGAEKILEREIDAKAHKKFLDELVAQI